MYQLPEAGPDSRKRITVLQTICHHGCSDALLPASNGQGTPLPSARKAFHPAWDCVVPICSLGSAGYWDTVSRTGTMPSTGCSSTVLENIAPGLLSSHHPL